MVSVYCLWLYFNFIFITCNENICYKIEIAMTKMENKISDRLDPDIVCENNGLVLKGYHLPEEIICEILSNISGKHILNCRLVCKRWSDIINFVLLNSYNRTFAMRYPDEVLPFDLRYITFYGNIYNKNLLKNVNGEENLKHWRFLENGGDSLIIEDPPQGSDQLPENIEEFKGHTSCFASSYGLARKYQYIDIMKDRHLSLIVNKYKPHIYVSEWVAARFDCGAKYQMCLQIQCANCQDVEKNINYQVAQWEGSTWKKLEFIIEEYPDNVELITFEHQASDTQFWKGHYGMKMAGAVVKLLLDKIKL